MLPNHQKKTISGIKLTFGYIEKEDTERRRNHVPVIKIINEFFIETFERSYFYVVYQ
jgi:hypothetical protein